MEAIEHVRTVQALTKEETFHEKFCYHLDAPHKDALRESFIQGLAYGFVTIFATQRRFLRKYKIEQKISAVSVL